MLKWRFGGSGDSSGDNDPDPVVLCECCGKAEDACICEVCNTCHKPIESLTNDENCEICTCCPDNAQLKITDVNNPNRSVTNGTLVMVNTEGSRDALFEIENIDGFQFPSDYPMWDVGSGTLSSSNSTSATASFTESEGIHYSAKFTCPTISESVMLVDENEENINFGQYIDLYFNLIESFTSNSFAQASTPLSGGNFEHSNDADLIYYSKNVDKYCDGSDFGKYKKITGELSYTLGLPRIESPRIPVAGIPIITFFSYFEASALTITGLSSIIMDQSKNYPFSGDFGLEGSIGCIEGGVALGVGVPNLAEVVCSGGLRVNGIDISGKIELSSTSVEASGDLVIGETGGVVSLVAKYTNGDLKLGEWDLTFLPLQNIPLGSTTLYTNQD